MNKPRKQHLIPQVYLKNFLDTSEGKQNSKLFKLRKNDDNRIIKTNIRDSAVQRDFYTYKDIYDWEYFYANSIEPSYKSISSLDTNSNCIFIGNGSKIISEDQKRIIAKLITYQWTRASHTRNYLRNIYKSRGGDLVNEIIETFPKKLFTHETMSRIKNIVESEEEYKEISYSTLTDDNRIGEYSKFIYLKKWLFIKIEPKESFVLSDNPVVIFNINETTVEPFVDGVLNKETGILFPISSSLILVVMPDILNIGSFFDKTIHRVNRKQSIILSKIANHIQYLWAESELYSSDKMALQKCSDKPSGHFVKALVNTILDILEQSI